MILIGWNPHATELLFLTPVPANKMEFYVHTCSSTRMAPYIHPRFDSILELSRISRIVSEYVQEMSQSYCTQPMAPRGRDTEPQKSDDINRTNRATSSVSPFPSEMTAKPEMTLSKPFHSDWFYKVHVC